MSEDGDSMLVQARDAFTRLYNASFYPHSNPPAPDSVEQQMYEAGIAKIHEAAKWLEDARKLSEVRRKKMIDDALAKAGRR